MVHAVGVEDCTQHGRADIEEKGSSVGSRQASPQAAKEEEDNKGIDKMKAIDDDVVQQGEEPVVTFHVVAQQSIERPPPRTEWEETVVETLGVRSREIREIVAYRQDLRNYI